MGFSSTRLEVISAYFECWGRHDLNLLRSLFVDCKHYEIIPKSKILTSYEEIEEYWVRNSGRQQDLKLEWSIRHEATGGVICDFGAVFFNRVSQQQQQISGWIDFSIRGNMITKLVEDYRKEIQS